MDKKKCPECGYQYPDSLYLPQRRPKTVGGFVRYLFGERFIEGSEADIQRLSESPRWKILSKESREERRELKAQDKLNEDFLCERCWHIKYRSEPKPIHPRKN